MTLNNSTTKSNQPAFEEYCYCCKANSDCDEHPIRYVGQRDQTQDCTIIKATIQTAITPTDKSINYGNNLLQNVAAISTAPDANPNSHIIRGPPFLITLFKSNLI